MDAAAFAMAARIVLAATLAIAAVQKLATMRTSRAATVALVGPRAGTVIGVALPFVELAVSVALLVWWSAVPGVVAFAVIVAFTVVLVRAQTRRLPCPCFGAAASAGPVGPWAIVRNGLLAALAVVATGSPAGASAAGVSLATIVLGVPAAIAVRQS
jgi:hypothetical protein